MDNSPLARLFRIDGFGKRIMQGSHYSVKFRIPKANASIVTNLKARYPEMLVHNASTGFIIFGGTFSTASLFWEDTKWLLDMKKRFKPLKQKS